MFGQLTFFNGVLCSEMMTQFTYQ